MAVSSAPGDRPPRGMIDPALHPPPAGFRTGAPSPLPPTEGEAAPRGAVRFGTTPTGPGFRHAESPLTPVAPEPEEADPAPDPGADELHPSDELDSSDETDPAEELDLFDDGTEPSRIAAGVRGRPLRAAVLALAVAVMVSAAGLTAILFRDARQTYTAAEVVSALRGFREPTGETQVSATTTWSRQLTVSPSGCTALVTQNPTEATDGARWSSTDGTGYERVQVQAVRFPDPRTARAVLRAMIDHASDCDRVLLTWQDDSPRWVRIRGATSSTGAFSAREELSYALRSSYGGQVYVRQFGNVIAFVAGIGEIDSGRQLGDDLVAELQSLATS